MLFLIFSILPSAQAANPAARWGHQAAFVDSNNNMYIVGGALSENNAQITNDVYILSVSHQLYNVLTTAQRVFPCLEQGPNLWPSRPQPCRDGLLAKELFAGGSRWCDSVMLL